MLLIPAILLMYESRFDAVRHFWLAIALYALAKLFEFADAAILSVGALVSGHTLKHIAASLVPWVLIHGMKKRRPIR